MDVEITETVKKQKKKIISLQIPESMYKVLKEEADNRFVSVSDVIRVIVYSSLIENKKERN